MFPEKQKPQLVYTILSIEERKIIIRDTINNEIDEKLSRIIFLRTAYRKSKQTEFDKEFYSREIIQAKNMIFKLKQIIDGL